MDVLAFRKIRLLQGPPAGWDPDCVTPGKFLARHFICVLWTGRPGLGLQLSDCTAEAPSLKSLKGSRYFEKLEHFRPFN